jgi:hypothetical protein
VAIHGSQLAKTLLTPETTPPLVSTLCPTVMVRIEQRNMESEESAIMNLL